MWVVCGISCSFEAGGIEEGIGESEGGCAVMSCGGTRSQSWSAVFCAAFGVLGVLGVLKVLGVLGETGCTFIQFWPYLPIDQMNLSMLWLNDNKT